MHSRVHSAVLIRTIRIPPVKKSYPDLTKKRLYHVHSLPKNTVCDEFLGVPDSDLKPKTLISTHQKSWKSPLCLRKIRFVLVPFMELVKYQSVGSSAICIRYTQYSTSGRECSKMLRQCFRVSISVVDPNTLNLDPGFWPNLHNLNPDPVFWPNFDPDPDSG